MQKKEITSLRITPDGRLLISGSLEGTIKIWNLKKRKLNNTLKMFETGVDNLILSPDGNIIIANSTNGILKLYHIYKKKYIQPYQDGYYSISKLEISPDGKLLLISYNYDDDVEEYFIEVMDFSTLEHLKEFDNKTLYFQDFFFTSDGKHLIGSYERCYNEILTYKFMGIFDIFKEVIISDLIKYRKTIIPKAITSDNRYVIFCTQFYIGIFDLNLRLIIKRIKLKYYFYHSVIITHNSKFVILGFEKRIEIWRIPTGKHFKTLKGHKKSIGSLVMTPNGKYLISGSKDGDIIMWDFNTGKIFYIFR